MNSPCKDCKERHLGCHSRCEAYQSYRAANIKRNEENHLRNEIKRYQFEFHERYIKKTKGRK